MWNYFFACVYFGLFTFVCLRHRSSAYRDLHTSHIRLLTSLVKTQERT